jgi:hypothetical protein
MTAAEAKRLWERPLFMAMAELRSVLRDRVRPLAEVRAMCPDNWHVLVFIEPADDESAQQVMDVLKEVMPLGVLTGVCSMDMLPVCEVHGS